MGLLDNFSDPRTQLLLSTGLGLLGGGANFAQNLSNAGMQGLNAYNLAQQRNAKLDQEKQQQQMRDLQIQQLKKAQEDQAYAQQIAPRFFQQGVTPNTPVDDNGNPMPSSPAKMDFSGYGAALAARNPSMGMPFIQAGMKDTSPIAVKAGESLVDRQTMKPLFTGKPAANWVPLGKQEAIAYGLPQSGQGFQRDTVTGQIKAVGSVPSAIVNVDNKQEGAFAQKVGSEYAQNYIDLQKSGAQAMSKVNKLDRLGNLLSQSGNTGKLTPTGMQLSATAASLGFKVDPRLPYQQAADALSNEIALELRNPSGGAGMPGALSDKDREFLSSMTPNLSKTPEGNRLLIDTAKKLAQRETQIAKMARDYKARNGRFDEGFYQQLADFSASNPLFGNSQSTQSQGSSRVIDFSQLSK